VRLEAIDILDVGYTGQNGSCFFKLLPFSNAPCISVKIVDLRSIWLRI